MISACTRILVLVSLFVCYMYFRGALWQETTTLSADSLLLINYLLPTLGAGSVVISPSDDFTTYENNTSNFTFNCSGNGTFLFWTVDGYTTGTQYVLSKRIQYTTYVVSPDGPTVSSQLIVPTTKANRNITVVCTTTVLFPPFDYQTSYPVRLILQGTAYMYM